MIFERLQNENELLKKKLEVAKKALRDIPLWMNEEGDDWEFPEDIAERALEKLAD